MCILKCFEEVSGLKVNMTKSRLYGVGVTLGEVIAMHSGVLERFHFCIWDYR